MNVSKSNYICNDKNEIPDETDNQKKIFDNQLSKYVETEDCKVAILNAFPIFLFDYFGKKVLEEANIENSKKQQIWTTKNQVTFIYWPAPVFTRIG